MEPLWLELAKQIPSLVVLGWLVVFFLKHIKEIVDNFQQTIKEVNKSCHEFQAECIKQNHMTISTNSLAMNENTRMLGKSAYVLSRFSKEENDS